jgi:fucose permease
MPMSAQRMFLRSILPLFVVLCLGILIIPVYPKIFS